ncbi:hypothetical protein HR51_41145 [Burkholderia cepacia]|nr:hypothetical protein HR51_41145 [Burkholderia cepacia]
MTCFFCFGSFALLSNSLALSGFFASQSLSADWYCGLSSPGVIAFFISLVICLVYLLTVSSMNFFASSPYLLASFVMDLFQSSMLGGVVAFGMSTDMAFSQELMEMRPRLVQRGWTH